ncbi:hypothetical protein COU96_03050 [Candidatus Shapirobacteria bacterium CG10_big_fil_rev_8_21_14_0_10_38_14]|uniref:glucose-1-phosphate thymidylyltransferase n=1 Tax=Candidatus Shapirobacteria bacterium CG10_big_fil_rev_8_21_14_0_10_38_14 TaxID=1974483 RepID=A0A2M8L4U8_9BACT|nr:MAG: hypothetical protein COU96_03050 [Candidatus Shapirobacteria bacterium CG10_big_fil_rev_8_21_14_0_10_38_14]
MKKIGILPCGGRGSRFKPFFYPKELFPFGYFTYNKDLKPKPIIMYAVESMVKAGVKKIFFVITPDKLEIMDFFRDGSDFGFDAAYFFQKDPGGSGIAFTIPAKFVNSNDLVFFQMPDNINIPINHFVKLLKQLTNHEVALGVFPSFNPNFFGRVEIFKNKGLAKSNQKPPATNTAVCSGIIKGSVFKELFLLARSNFDQIINKNDPQQELRLLVLLSYYEQMAKNKFYYHYFKSGQCLDIGDPKNLKKIICSLKKHQLIQ